MDILIQTNGTKQEEKYKAGLVVRRFARSVTDDIFSPIVKNDNFEKVINNK